jgi:hypothetical protein
VEWLVGALAVLGFIAIIVRFVPRDEAGQVRLPRIVDDSIGMWALRRLTGRRLGMLEADDDLGSALAPPRNSAPGRRRSARAAVPAHMVSSTPVLDLRRRQQAPVRRRRSPSLRRLAAFASIAAVLIIALAVGAAIGAADRLTGQQGEVLSVTGRPGLPANAAPAVRSSAEPSVPARTSTRTRSP